jgi:glycosyltransferase involved in cell wall biosynthesis
MSSPRFSVIIPVYNRPAELLELLASLVQQPFRDFEVIIVEDGSLDRCDRIVDQFRAKLVIHYFFKQNEGPGLARNFGFSKAVGDYFLIFDSDCIIPPTYFAAVTDSLSRNAWDAWGGPDKAHGDFTVLQRAMGYTMSSMLTTGGIRGGKKSAEAFLPRSFNMGISRKVFNATGGFNFTHYAEDIELSIRIREAGFAVGLIPDAFVYHKRRTNLEQFFQQVFNFGRGRAMVGRAHPLQVKLTHWFPSVFFIGTVSLPVLPFVSAPLAVIGYCILFLYLLAILIDAWSESGDVRVALFAVPSALTQLFGYGIGFLIERLNLRR